MVCPHKKLIRPSAALLGLFLLAAGCKITPVATRSHSNPYRTSHFTIYYDHTQFEPGEIERIGLLKESLLEHVNEYLGTDYDRRIEVIISDTIDSYARAHYYERTWETTAYARDDNGHEIAHIVSMQKWGYPSSAVLMEGVAVAAQRDTRASALERYRGYSSRGSRGDAPENESDLTGLRDNILHGDFDYTPREYARAGAFVHCMKTRYGIHAVKQWYVSMIGVNEPAGASDVFRQTFGVQLDSALYAFGEELQRKE